MRHQDSPHSRTKPAVAPAALQRTLLALGLIIVAGCASERDDQLIERLAREVRERPAHLAETTTRPAGADDAVPPNAGPADYVRLALERNPRLAAAAARVRQLTARVPQARALDDPMLSVAPIGDMAQTASGQVDTMVELSQRLKLPQKYEARGEVAEREAAAAVAALERVRQEVAAEAQRAFWTYWLADRQLAVMRQSRDLLADLRESATAQLRAGRAGQADVLRAATELAELDNRLLDQEQDREVAAAALNRLLDRPPTAPLPEPPDAVATATEAAIDALLADAQANPRLAARLAEVEAARQRLRLAKLDYWPDLTVMANYAFIDDEGLSMLATGDNQWSLGFGINIPLWQGPRRAAVREQRAAVLESLAALNAEGNDIAFEVRQAAAEVDARRRLVELLNDTVLPQARQTVEATAAAYRAGDADFLSYVDAWRRLLDFELAQLRATSDLGQAVADLEQAAGDRLQPETK